MGEFWGNQVDIRETVVDKILLENLKKFTFLVKFDIHRKY